MTQLPISATAIDAIKGKTIYPEPYASRVKGRLKRKLGDYFGLSNFGVNLTHLEPGSMSGLRHSHSKQEEFIFILEGTPTLILGSEEIVLHPGQCYGYPAGNGVAHHLINRSDVMATYLEIGDRTLGDEVEYPDDDLKATLRPDGEWQISHKDDRPYP